jgi:NADPH:quinone reductase-like Zn-dependent oxidoreductase
VLVKVRAFSCNHTDKALIFAISRKCGEGACYSCVGSEFVGEVIAVGMQVSKFQVGDRVMGNNQFATSDIPEILPGFPTNSASRRCRYIHEDKLISVPFDMPDIVAAAFSVGAQTSYSMVRKLHVQAGKNILVTASTSNISLFVVNMLKNYALNIYTTTTKGMNYTRYKLIRMGVKEVIPVTPSLFSLRENRRIEEIVMQTGGFDYIIDPFFDLYLSKVMYTLAVEGIYITCGRGDLYQHLTEQTFLPKSQSLQDLMLYATVHNIQLIGNMSGQTEDLVHALADYSAGLLDITIDSVFRENEVAAFFERTYNAPDRFGKVVYCYDD